MILLSEIFNTHDINWEGNYSRSTFAGTSKGINCPYCKAFASMKWGYGQGWKEKIDLKSDASSSSYQPLKKTIIRSDCTACSKVSYWIKSDSTDEKEKLLFPPTLVDMPDPNTDMPDKVKEVYIESATVLDSSPRASAALSRLAIDILTKELEPTGSTLNDRIGNLVKNGLPDMIQKALDIVRVVGNNAIHPGTIDLSDNKDMAISLLKLLNIITENRITQPKEIDSMFHDLPESNKKQIRRRDS